MELITISSGIFGFIVMIMCLKVLLKRSINSEDKDLVVLMLVLSTLLWSFLVGVYINDIFKFLGV